MAKIVANTGTRSTKAPLAKALGPRKGVPMKPGLKPVRKGPGGPMQPLPKGSPGPGSGGYRPIPKGRGRGPMKPGLQ